MRKDEDAVTPPLRGLLSVRRRNESSSRSLAVLAVFLLERARVFVLFPLDLLFGQPGIGLLPQCVLPVRRGVPLQTATDRRGSDSCVWGALRVRFLAELSG